MKSALVWMGRVSTRAVLLLLVTLGLGVGAARAQGSAGVTYLGAVGSTDTNNFYTFRGTSPFPSTSTSTGGGNFNDGVAFLPNGSKFFVTRFSDNILAIVDSATGTVTNLGGFTGPEAVAVSPDGSKVYVTNYGAGTISVVDPVSQTIVGAPIAGVGDNPISVAFSPDGSRAYVSSFTGGTVRVIDTATDTTIDTVTIGGLLYGVTVTPDGSKVYAARFDNGSLISINTTTLAQTAIALGAGASPRSVAAAPDGSTVYVTGNGTNLVYVINPTNDTVSTTIAVTAPAGVAFSPDGTQAFVQVQSGTTISVIDTASGTVTGTVTGLSRPFGTNQFIGPALVTGTLGAGSAANLLTAGIGLNPAFGNSLNIAGGTLQATGSFTAANPLYLHPAFNIPGILTTAAGGTIDTNSFDLTLSGIISGPGALTKIGAGTLTLGGTNTYAGGTSVTGGTLAVSADANLGAALTGLSLDGAILQFGAPVSTARAVTLGAGGGSIDSNGNAVTLSGVIGGAGALTKTGGGTLTISNTNGYGGATSITAGTLALLGGDAIPNASAVSIADIGTLDLSGVAETVGSISGAGGILLGVGTLTAGGNGLTTTFSGAISGGGGLTKMGAGSLTLSGTSGYTGATTVAVGTLVVNGTQGGSAVTVNTGATLLGTGTVGATTIDTGATIAPGNSIGTLSVNGAYAQAAGSTYINEVNTTTADRIAVTGTATLNGAVDVQATAGNYGARTTYTILSSTGLVGQYASVTDNLASYTSSLANVGNDVILTLLLNPVFQSSGLSPNQSAVGLALDQLIASGQVSFDFNLVVTELLKLDSAGLQSALNQIGQQTNIGTSQTILQSGSALRGAVLSNLSLSRSAARGAGTKGSDDKQAAAPGKFTLPAVGAGMMSIDPLLGAGSLAAAASAGDKVDANADDQVWLLGVHQSSELDETANAAGFDSDGNGFVLGRTWRDSKTLTWGVHGGFVDSRVNQRFSSNKVETDNFRVGAHASLNEGNRYVDGTLEYGWTDNDSSRVIQFAGINRVAKADFNGDELSAYVEAGQVFERGDVNIQPQLSLLYRDFSLDSYQENGAGALNLAVDGTDLNSLQSGLGARLFGRCKGDNGTIFVPDLVARWSHEFQDVDPRTRSTFLGTNGAFTLAGRQRDRDSFQGRVGLTGYTTGNWDVDLSYNGEWATGQRSDAVVARAAYRW